MTCLEPLIGQVFMKHQNCEIEGFTAMRESTFAPGSFAIHFISLKTYGYGFIRFRVRFRIRGRVWS